MKRTKIVLLFFIIGFMLSGCPEEKDYEGSLTIQNAPAGYSFSARIYPGSTLPNNYSEYLSMTTSEIAYGKGGSPIKLYWWRYGTQSGRFLLELRSRSIKKLSVVEFKNGDAVANWNSMTDVPD